MWKLAPDGAMLGLVASGKAVGDFQAAYTEVIKSAQSVPMLKPYLDEMTAELQKNLGTGALTLDALGLEAKPAAIFMMADKEGVFVLPVKDRDKFLTIAKGEKGADGIDHLGKHKDTECKVRDGLYTCVSSKKMWDLIGKGKLDITPAGARGELEFVGKDLPTGKDRISAAIVEQHARGAVTWRGKITNLPVPPQLAMAPMKPRTEGDKTTGFATISVKSLLGLVPMPDPQAAAVLKTIDDPITMVSQTNTIDLRVPLNDPAPIKAFLDKCEVVGGQFGAKVVDGACEVPIPQMPSVLVDVWLDGKTLRVGQKKAAAGDPVPQDALAKELADGTWSMALYGRGSILASNKAMADQWKQMSANTPPDFAPMIENIVRAMLLVNEMGLGVRIEGTTASFVFGIRTMWANDEATVQKLVALDPADIMNGTAAAQAKQFATGPLKDDLTAGWTGLIAPTSIVGMLSAVAVPAFLQYNTRAKAPEAMLQLNRIGKAAKVTFIENAAFPIGDAWSTTAKTCCGQGNPIDNKCVPDTAAMAKDPVWSKLDYTIDEPTVYRYHYHSDDGKTAYAEAIGDADCDTKEATYRLDLTAPAGNPTMNITPPAPGVY